jgi:hypothetical protein
MKAALDEKPAGRRYSARELNLFFNDCGLVLTREVRQALMPLPLIQLKRRCFRQSRRLHFLSRGFRGVHPGPFHPVEGFGARVIDLVFQRVSGFAHALRQVACALA